jgi:hypothetical protein
MPPFAASFFRNFRQIKKDMAEASGSRTQTFNSQLTANDDVAASAKFQLESERSLPAKLCLINGDLLPYSLFGPFRTAEILTCSGRRFPTFGRGFDSHRPLHNSC